LMYLASGSIRVLYQGALGSWNGQRTRAPQSQELHTLGLASSYLLGDPPPPCRCTAVSDTGSLLSARPFHCAWGRESVGGGTASSAASAVAPGYKCVLVRHQEPLFPIIKRI
jgi:hypothetical protein